MANRQVIVLDGSVNGAGNLLVRAAYWLVAPTNRVVALPSFTSQVPSSDAIPSYGINSTELGLLRTGALVEQVTTISITNSGATNTTVQTALAAQFTTLQAALTAQVFGSPHLVGSSFNGTAWTAGP